MTALADVSNQLKRDIYLHFHNERENAGACLRWAMVDPEEHDQIIRSSICAELISAALIELFTVLP